MLILELEWFRSTYVLLVLEAGSVQYFSSIQSSMRDDVESLGPVGISYLAGSLYSS
jgi:hypothetical protein